MIDIGIQTDELYINGMPLREFLLLDIPQTHYLKMIDNVDADAASTSSDTDAQEEEKEKEKEGHINLKEYNLDVRCKQ